MSTTIQAADVVPGMILDRLTYVPRGDVYPDLPRYVTAAVVTIEPSTVIIGGYQIEWSDGKSAGYGPTDRFIRTETRS